MRRSTILATLVVCVCFLLAAGCEDTRQTSPTVQTNAGPTNNDDLGGNSPSQGASSSARAKAILTTSTRLGITINDIAQALAKAEEDSGQTSAAAGELSKLAPQLQIEAKAASLAILGMGSSQGLILELGKLSVEAKQAMEQGDFETAAEIYGISAEQLEKYHKTASLNNYGDFVGTLAGAARNTQSTELHAEIAKIRDIILNNRAPLATPKIRQKAAQTLGGKGGPLIVR